jgi:putative FmdB family regulatory protein
MPTYEYCCAACGHRFEQSQSITAAPLRKCPACAKRTLQRLMGTGGGIIFKGSGFHETDYRSESYKTAADAEKKAVESGDGKDATAKTAEKTAGSRKPAKPTCGAGKKG